MILVSARIFGIALGTWKITLGLDLPPFDYKKNIGVLQLEITTGPRTRSVPEHAEELKPHVASNQHEAAAPEVAASLENWS